LRPTFDDNVLGVEGACKHQQAEPDGSMLQHADLSALLDDWNEIVVDGRGNIYVNGRCDFDPGEGDPAGIIAVVTPDGSVRQVADAIAFPNCVIVTPDNSTNRRRRGRCSLTSRAVREVGNFCGSEGPR
jgi:sugar lactone lactonase YvrE